jgi:hypothetical protein
MDKKIIELILDEEAIGGIDAMSLVKFPAIEKDFITLSKQKKLPKGIVALANEERRLAIGPALIPDKMIPRLDEDGEEYFIFFKKETVRQASYQFLKANRQSNATLEHETSFTGATIVESWIVESAHDKAVHLGYEVGTEEGQLHPGTWMIAMHIENDEIWKLAKDGKVAGFSIEGFFTDALEAALAATDKQILEGLSDALKRNPALAGDIHQMLEWTAVDAMLERVREKPELRKKILTIIEEEEKNAG